MGEPTVRPLSSIEGFEFSLLVSAGSEERAQRIAARCTAAFGVLSTVLEFRPQVAVVVLDQVDWPSYASIPVFSMPHCASIAADLGAPAIEHANALIVGSEPGQFFEELVTLVGECVDADALTHLAAITGAADSGRPDMAAFADLLIVHELGHMFHIQVPFDFPRPWLRELFANLCLHTYLEAHERESLPLIEVFPSYAARIPGDRFAIQSLAQFDAAYPRIAPANYAWYQAGFHVAAKAMFGEHGVRAVRRMRDVFRRVDGAGFSDSELASLLETEVSVAAAAHVRHWPRPETGAQ